MVSFALKTLLSDRGKLLIALAGVVFSLILVNVQGGLYFGLIKKASLLTDHCGADIWVAHRLVECVDFAYDIPETRLNRIRGLPGVQEAEPYLVGKGIATLPDEGYEDIWIIGCDPKTMLGADWPFVQGSRSDLLRPDAISIDELDARKLGFAKIGDTLEVNGHRARVVAKTRGMLGFLTTPYLVATLDTARRLSGIPDGYCSYFLVRAEPDTDLQQLCAVIRQQLPEMDVYTSDELGKLSQDYFLKRTGIGISFGAATSLGLFVGLLMVAQSLYASALDHLTDYATLKAMGADGRQLAVVVVSQALLIALLGSVIGVALVLLIQHNFSSPIAPIEIPPELLVGGIVLVFGICLAATILPLLRIRSVDPVTVLQG